MKISKTGNYIILTEDNGKLLYSAPAGATKVKTDDNGVVVLYNETVQGVNYTSVIIKLSTLKDSDGNELEGGALAWLHNNTGFNAATIDPEVVAQKLDKGGYEGTAQDLKNEIDGAVSGYRGDLQIADIPTEDGIYTPTEAGTYTNAGGLVYAPTTTDQGKFVQFIKTGASWIKNTIAGGAYSKNETDVYRTLMEADILNSNQIITMVDGLPSEIIHKRAGVTIRTDTYTFSGNQVIESRELPTGEKVTLTTNTLTLTTNIVYYGI